MPSLTPEAVRALAPDAGALKAGQGLASGRQWVALGRSEQALWGSCQGSGKEPYQVIVDLAGPAAKCTCPSRKFPCKHGLGLMFMAASGSIGSVAPEPAHVSAWLADRARRASTAVKRETGEGDDPKTVEARARDRERRAAQREDRVVAGIAEFRRWLEDLARRGLAEVDDRQAFESAAARLVDAQAGELARDVRALARAIALEGPLADEVLDRIGRLYLVCETFDRRDRIDARLAAEVRSRIGWTVREADLPDDDAVSDRWVVAARRHEEDGRLRETRTWLQSVADRRWAVLIDFAQARTDPSNEPPVGATIEGRVAFYPGASALRGALRADWRVRSEETFPEAAPDFASALAQYAAAVARDPFVEQWPVAIADIRIGWDRGSGRLALVDVAGATVPTRLEEASVGPLIAYSGGRPMTVAGEWDGHSLRVLAAGDGQSWIALPGTDRAAAPKPAAAASAASAVPSGPPDPAWSALVAWATLGTGRAGPDPVLGPLVERMADRSPEQRLLGLVTALSARRRVSRSPDAPPADLPALEPAPAEARPRPPRPVVVALTDGASPVLRDERVAMLDAHGWLVPPELLPTPALAPPIAHAAALGRRAGWLSRYVSGYRPWGVEGEELGQGEIVARLEAQSTSPVERQAYFAAFRRSDAATARDWLAAAWPTLKMNDKAMVAGLETGLSAADAPFLEAILPERNVERRQVVARLLSRLPSSGYAARVETRGRALVERKNRLTQGLRLVPPSADAYADMEGDGCVVPTEQWSGGPKLSEDDRAYRALDWHARHIAPARWTQWLGLSPAAVIHEFASLAPRQFRSSSAALGAGAVLHRDATFAALLLDTADQTLGARKDELWALVPPQDRERLAIKVMRSADEPDEPIAALRALDGHWTRSMVSALASDIETWAGRLSERQRWQALTKLRAIATYGPVELLPSLIARLEATDADSRDIVALADARRRFAEAVAQAGGTS